MLSLEGAALQIAREKYFDYVADARLDRSEPIEGDEQARLKSPVIFPKCWTSTATRSARARHHFRSSAVASMRFTVRDWISLPHSLRQ
jgi:hypothetical protein